MTHSIGFLTVHEGSIASMDLKTLYDEVAIIIDTSDGCFHKVGSPEWVKPHYEKMVQRFVAIGPEYVEGLTYIEFNPKTGDSSLDGYFNAKFSKDEICTLVNYFQNHIGEERMKEIMTMSESMLHKELARLNKIGF